MKRDDLDPLREAARHYNAPPEPPREEMWAAVRSALPHGEPGTDPDGRRRWLGRKARLRRWSPWALGLAAAATLAVGFGLGRLTEGPSAASGDEPDSAAASAGAGVAREASLPFRLAAADHMGEAEALLTLYRSSTRAEDRAATARWARDLLGTTRLLMDSRVGRDPETAELLADLELVLVQIVDAAGTDAELVEQGIRERQLLTKLRTASDPSRVSM